MISEKEEEKGEEEEEEEEEEDTCRFSKRNPAMFANR